MRHRVAYLLSVLLVVFSVPGAIAQVPDLTPDSSVAPSPEPALVRDTPRHATSAARRPGQVGSHEVIGGNPATDHGSIDFTAPGASDAGVILQADSSDPKIHAVLGGSTSSSGFVVFNAADAYLLNVLGNGNVGIGTPSPTTLLHIERNVAALVALRIENGDGGSETAAAATELLLTEDGVRKVAIQSIGTETPVAKAVGGPGALRIMNYAEGPIVFFRGTTERMRIATDGNIGIGTISPTEKLHVVGNLKVSGSITGGTVIGAVYQDVAEWVPATTDLAPGTVVVLNHARSNEVMASHGAYDTSVAGVVSAQPGVILGIEGANKEQVATTGRVKVRVDARDGAVRVGDLLVTSDVAGTAMKSEPTTIDGRRFHQPGTIIGKALEPLDGGIGEILVLLSLQ